MNGLWRSRTGRIVVFMYVAAALVAVGAVSLFFRMGSSSPVAWLAALGAAAAFLLGARLLGRVLAAVEGLAERVEQPEEQGAGDAGRRAAEPSRSGDRGGPVAGSGLCQPRGPGGVCRQRGAGPSTGWGSPPRAGGDQGPRVRGPPPTSHRGTPLPFGEAPPRRAAGIPPYVSREGFADQSARRKRRGRGLRLARSNGALAPGKSPFGFCGQRLSRTSHAAHRGPRIYRNLAAGILSRPRARQTVPRDHAHGDDAAHRHHQRSAAAFAP